MRHAKFHFDKMNQFIISFATWKDDE